MAVRNPPTFLQLARELRDQIYDDALLFTTLGKPPQSIPPESLSSDIVDASDSAKYFTLKWRLSFSPGSCFGLMYSCRKVYTEMLESIERHDGVSFELDLSIMKSPSSLDVDIWAKLDVWAEWVVLPICTYVIPTVQAQSGLGEHPASLALTKSKCQNMRVSCRIQSETELWWWGTVGPSPLTRGLFTMLANFLLRGPSGLRKDPKNINSDGSTWCIDTLSLDIIGHGTSYVNPYNGQHYTVPSEVVEDAEQELRSHLINTVCSSGALSGRVRVVRLLVDGKVKYESIIDQTKSLSAETRIDWKNYGCKWVFE